MPYSMNMNDEKKPSVRKLMPEGWLKFTILSCEPQVSKKGNDMFKIEIQEEKTGGIETIYPIATQGKRWMLKKLLKACGIPASQDGVYDWSESDIIGKVVAGLNEHEDSEYINREGVTVSTKQNRINDFEPVDNVIQWDEGK